jgi:hypothetical protein
MHKIIIDSKILEDGHLFLPDKYRKLKNAKYKVIILSDIPVNETSEYDMNVEASSASDLSAEYLTDRERDYYLNLD